MKNNTTVDAFCEELYSLIQKTSSITFSTNPYITDPQVHFNLLHDRISRSIYIFENDYSLNHYFLDKLIFNLEILFPVSSLLYQAYISLKKNSLSYIYQFSNEHMSLLPNTIWIYNNHNINEFLCIHHDSNTNNSSSNNTDISVHSPYIYLSNSSIPFSRYQQLFRYSSLICLEFIKINYYPHISDIHSLFSLLLSTIFPRLYKIDLSHNNLHDCFYGIYDLLRFKTCPLLQYINYSHNHISSEEVDLYITTLSPVVIRHILDINLSYCSLYSSDLYLIILHFSAYKWIQLQKLDLTGNNFSFDIIISNPDIKSILNSIIYV
ncbi:hypothetical protein WA158_005220 [Blastocystis sp. Blastoise]